MLVEDVHYSVRHPKTLDLIDAYDIYQVDMSMPYDAPFPGEESDFADIRDSFYLLMNFNQYEMKPLISMTKEAEGLLRIVLFSKDLKLSGTNKTLNQARRKLVRVLRSNRKRGVVPVFISTLWFLFAVGISIESGQYHPSPFSDFSNIYKPSDNLEIMLKLMILRLDYSCPGFQS
jgi:hypothetical protein